MMSKTASGLVAAALTLAIAGASSIPVFLSWPTPQGPPATGAGTRAAAQLPATDKQAPTAGSHAAPQLPDAKPADGVVDVRTRLDKKLEEIGDAMAKYEAKAWKDLVKHPWWAKATEAQIASLVDALVTAKPSFWIFNDKGEFFQADIADFFERHYHDRDGGQTNGIVDLGISGFAKERGWLNYGSIHIDSAHGQRYTRSEIIHMIASKIEGEYFRGKK